MRPRSSVHFAMNGATGEAIVGKPKRESEFSRRSSVRWGKEVSVAAVKRGVAWLSTSADTRRASEPSSTTCPLNAGEPAQLTNTAAANARAAVQTIDMTPPFPEYPAGVADPTPSNVWAF